jgi:hypothetical protein
VILAVVLILILVYRPTGIMGNRELRWPHLRQQVGPVEPAEPQA